MCEKVEIPEKLVEEVIEQARCIIAEDGSPMECGRACYLIRRIGKVYADGELKLPREELRGKVGFPRVDNMATVYVTMGGDIVFDDGEYLLRPQDGDILIALRKEEEK